MDQKYLLFLFKDNLNKYTCFPNGLTSAPRIFTKILKPVFSGLWKEGHQMMGYLDDTSKQFLSQEIEILDFVLNSGTMTISLSASKQNDFKSTIKELS